MSTVSNMKKIYSLIFGVLHGVSLFASAQCANQLSPQQISFSPNTVPQPIGTGWVSSSSAPLCLPFESLLQFGFGAESFGYAVNIGPSVGDGPLNGGFTLVQLGQTLNSFGVMVGNRSSWNGAFAVTGDGTAYLVKDLVLGGNPFIGTPTTVTYSSIIRFSEIDNGLNTNVAVKDISQAISATALNGAHSQPLSRRVGVGERGFWISGDLGTDNHGARSGGAGLADFGFGYNYGAYQLNLSLGETWSRQAPAADTYKSTGNYLLVEAIIPLDGGVWLSLGGYGHKGEFNSSRAYESSLGKSISKGSSDTRTLGWRAHLDFENLVNVYRVNFSPYLDLSKTISKLDGYAETGGDYPAIFDIRKDDAMELRLGVNAKTLVSENIRLLGVIEGVRRVSEKRAHVSGQFVDVGSFDYSSNTLNRDWLRFGVGLESKIAEGIGSINLNMTTKGESLDKWIAVLWVKSF